MNSRIKYFVIAGAIILVLLIGVTVFSVQAIINASEKSKVPTTSTEEKTLTVEGEMTCLVPKDTSGVQDMSCAIGMKTDDEKYYGLNATDPTKIGSIPTGTRIKASGVLKADSSKYKTEGIIQISSMERL